MGVYRCNLCDKSYTRSHDLGRHKENSHEDEPTETEDSESDHSPTSEAEESSDSEALEPSTSESDSEDESVPEDNVWNVWDDLLSEAIESHMSELEDGEDLEDAYQQLRPSIVKTLMALYLRLNQRHLSLEASTIHAKIVSTMSKLEETMDLSEEEAWENAVRMRKRLFEELLPLQYPGSNELSDAEEASDS